MFRIGRLLTRLASRNSLTCRVQPIALQSKCLFSYDRNPVYRASAPLCFMPSNRRLVSTEASPDPGRYKLSTIPNALCVGRIIATPFVGYLVVQHQFPVAFALFAVAGATDMLDGYIARNFPGQKSLLGSVLDPIADKLLVSVMFVTMSCASLIPWQLTAVVLTRDLCLVVGGFYKRYQTMEPPYSLKRFFNPEVSSMQVVPTMISKVNTVLQLSLIATCLSIPVFSLGDASASLSCGLCWVTALTTVWSGLQYASGRAFKKI